MDARRSRAGRATWTIAGLNYRGYGRAKASPASRRSSPTRWRSSTRSLRGPTSSRAASSSSAAASAPAWPQARGRAAGRRRRAGLAVRQPGRGRPKAHYPWLPVSCCSSHRFDSLGRRARQRACRCSTIVGEADGIIPLSRSRALHEAWPGPENMARARRRRSQQRSACPNEFWDGIGRLLARSAARMKKPLNPTGKKHRFSKRVDARAVNDH